MVWRAQVFLSQFFLCASNAETGASGSATQQRTNAADLVNTILIRPFFAQRTGRTAGRQFTEM